MTDDPFQGASWIARPVPAAQRITRENRRDRIDYARPDEELSQTFRALGPVVAVGADIAGPPDTADAFTLDVRFTLTLQRADGTTVAERVVEGPQLLWDWFGQLIALDVPAPAGDYRLVLRPERGTIGWHTADPREPEPDDGVSPLPIRGEAARDGIPQPGTRLIVVDTPPAPNPVFRAMVDLEAPVRSAALSTVVLGCGIVRINGRRVGDAAIEPAVTDYDRTVLYRTHNVAHLLRPGRNDIVIEAGRERYAARGGDIWGWNAAPWHREPPARLSLVATDIDGRVTTLGTDDTWECTVGEVESELLFCGENWLLGGETPRWERASVVAPPHGILREAPQPPMTLAPSEPPVVVEHLDAHRTVYDFGRVLTGRVRLTVSGEAGASVQIVSGEQRTDDGTVVCDNTLVAGRAQRDTIRLASAVEQREWHVRFGYRGFRWVQIETTGDVRVEHVRAEPIVTELEQVGAFACDSPVIEWIDGALARTFRNNLHGIPTDTPIYEKNGWTADAHLATEALLHHVDLRTSFEKWLGDHRDAQGEDGSIPQIIPTPGWGRSSDPAWSASAVLIPWYLYQEHGDLRILERNAEMIRRLADQLVDRSQGGLWPDRSWGDWLAPGYGVPPEGMAPTGTAMTVSVLDHVASIVAELGDHASADEYAATARRTARAYHEAYFDETAGHYRVPGAGYRQSMDILALAFGIAPAEHVSSVRASLVRDLETRTNGHLDCGAVGVRHLLPVLEAAGRDDLALGVLLQRSRPGWGVWFDDGERTLLESWDADARSRNHYFLGSVDSWIQQRVGGLRRTAPGWRSFTIAPVRDDRVTRAAIRHRTPLGEAAVAWERAIGGWRFDVTVPDGAEATVVAGAREHRISAGRHTLVITEQA